MSKAILTVDDSASMRQMVVLTDVHMPRMDGKRAGATGWIVKPFNPAQLLATVARVI